MTTKAARRKRLLRLPTVENFSRNNWRRTDDTKLALVNLDRSPPPFSLQPVKKLCAGIASGAIDPSELEARLQKIKHDAVHKAASEVIPEFLRFLSRHHVVPVPAFDGFRITYPIGPNPDGGTLAIPVAPTFVCILDGALTPVFLIPWSKLALSDFQKALMSSIIEDALLTHQDFIDCDAKILAFPLIEDTRQRFALEWDVRAYARLDREELNHQFLTYGRALESVLVELDAEPE